VADAFTEIQDELRSQYLVSYTPPDLIADGHFRPVEISAWVRRVSPSITPRLLRAVPSAKT